MKTLFLLCVTLGVIFASSFKVGTLVTNFQNNEGSGISFGYQINKKLLLETSYNEYYLIGSKGGSKEKWSSYNTQKLALRYYLKDFDNGDIKLFTTLGLEYLFKNTKLSTEGASLNTFFLAGTDFMINEKFNLYFTLGSGGKGGSADKYDGEPGYAHGFISTLGVEYNF
jgi:hypothetical protein